MTASEGVEPRVGIVTGASSGIGAATAIALARHGLDVGITYNANEAGARACAEAIRELGRRCAVVQLDLSAPGDADQAIATFVDELGRVDGLVNNAGSVQRVEALDETVQNWNERLAIGLVGPWACSCAVARHMIEAGRGGRIVNVTSVLAFAPAEGCVTYCAAKAGAELLTKVLALEWAQHGITVNAVAPGHTATPMNFAEEELDGSVIERPVIPLARAAGADEVAEAIAFLVAGEAKYVTGASLLVDGGLLLRSGPQALQEALTIPVGE